MLFLTIMAGDRYVAIRQCLQYPIIMNPQFCVCMTLASLLSGLVYAAGHRPDRAFPDLAHNSPLPEHPGLQHASGPNPAGEVDMSFAGRLLIVALVVTVCLTWMVVGILLGGPASEFPHIQQFFNNSESSVTAEQGPASTSVAAFCMVSGAVNIIEPKMCLEDRMLMSSVKDNVGPGLNVALVNGVSCDLIEACASDMWARDVNDLLNFIWPLHEGTLVFVASCNNPVTKMNEEARNVFF
ncbi:Protein FAM3A [Sciurus carolinensis]|uniref:Protein FAM3A n=2 Tax=Sciurus carolinensis TaxID=30640 RepID=A0AA41MY75_SCICA|nr:Protein FAM3A [Sciurus carolinensis]